MKVEDVLYNPHFAKCPYCGYEDRDSWGLGDDGESECGECGKEYTYTRYIEESFTCRPKVEE